MERIAEREDQKEQEKRISEAHGRSPPPGLRCAMHPVAPPLVSGTRLQPWARGVLPQTSRGLPRLRPHGIARATLPARGEAAVPRAAPRWFARVRRRRAPPRDRRAAPGRWLRSAAQPDVGRANALLRSAAAAAAQPRRRWAQALGPAPAPARPLSRCGAASCDAERPQRR